MRHSLRAKVVAFTVSLSLIPLLIVSLALLGISYNARRNDVLKRQQDNAQQLAVQTVATLGEIQQTMDVVARTSNWKALEPAEQRILIDTLYQYRTLALLESGFGTFNEVLLLDGDGQPIAGRSASRGMSLEAWAQQVHAEAFDLVMQDQIYWGSVYISPGYQLPAIAIAMPTRDLAGHITGLLWGAIDLDKALWPIITAPAIPEGTLVYLFDGQGYPVVRNDEHFVQRDEVLSGERHGLLPVQSATRLGDQQGIETYKGLTGQQVVGAWQPVAGKDWTLVVETPTNLSFADVRRLLMPAILLSLATIGVAVGAGILASQVLTRPVEHLRAGAELIGTGDLDHQIEIRSQDEIGGLARAFNQMAASLRSSRAEIEQWGRELENKVEERTHELAEASQQMQRRAIQLQTSAEVARAIASVRDLDQLLPQVTQLISQRFGWYHVGIFLIDDQGEYAVLRAANSEGGQQMLARDHKLKVGLAGSQAPGPGEPAGIVGYVTSTGQPRIALDVGEDAVYFDTPELHGTHSEMALPLKVGGPQGERIIGALDVQSIEPSAYDDQDVTALSIMADQVAIAIENARHFEQTQQALEEVRTLHREYVRGEWGRAVSGQRDLAYEYRRSGTPPLDDPLPPELAIALTEGKVAAIPDPGDLLPGDDGGNGRTRAALAAPIKLRDQVIGALDLQEIEGPRQWTDDEIALVQAISDQVALALENARLFADTQRRAEQLATLHRVGLDVTSALDLEGVVTALYEQLRRIMDAGSFYIALYDQATGIIEFPLLTGRDGRFQLEPLNIHDQPGVTGHIIHSGQPLYIPDLQAETEDTPYHAIALTEHPTRSYLGVPLIFREQVFGVLSIQSYEPNAYSESDLELLVTLATQASIAIQNARAYERLMEIAEELRELDRLKTQFLANMSHELRTPLNSIIGFSRVMLKGIDGPLTDLQEADLTSIYNSGQHLLNLINSILDMSKIEAGKMDLSFDEVHLPEIFNAVMSTTQALIKDEPIQLKSMVPEDLPTVWADAQRVRQVLINLMSNAAKFTEKGHIHLKAEAGSQFVTISVSDTGIGIEPEAQTRLFIPFQQVDSSTTRRAGGTGLGLAISRSFIEMLGGKIWVESEPGKGATFFFTLPIYQVGQRKAKSDADIELDPNKKLILAIDDDQGVLILLRRYLENDGYQVVGALESPLGLEMARRLAPNLTAITLDVVMPDMDGWEVLRALKQDPRTEQIPVILCSVVEGLEQGLGLGAAVCLKKPVTRDEVLEALERVERQVSRTSQQ